MNGNAANHHLWNIIICHEYPEIWTRNAGKGFMIYEDIVTR